ncbi:MAG: hypothetical protein U0893_01565 [Chloroflexota bacterium]
MTVFLVLLFGGANVASAHEAQQASTSTPRADRQSVDEASQLTDELRVATKSPPRTPALQAAYATKSQRRNVLLNQLVKTEPALVLSLALTPAERAQLPPAMQANVEDRVSLDGELQVRHIDYDDGHSEYDIRLLKNGQATRMYFGAPIGKARPGDVVRFDAVSLAGSNTVVSDRMVVVHSPTAVGTTGPQRTAIVLVNGGNNPAGHPYADKTNVASVFFSSANPLSGRNYYLEMSYNQTSIVGGNGAEGTAADVYGPVTVASTACDAGDPGTANTFATQALTAADPLVDYNNYDRVVFVINNPANACGNGGIGTVRTNSFGPFDGNQQQLSISWLFNTAFGPTTLNGRVGGTTLHEYGHNMGVWHSNMLECGNDAITGGTCYSEEYGDPADIMGGAGGYGHFNGVHKDTVEWLTGARAQTVTTNGSFTINSYEDGTNNTKVLRVARTRDAGGAVDGFYYVEYRKPTANWNQFLALRPDYGNGVLVHTAGTTPLCTAYCNPDFSGLGGGGDTNLLDTHPNSRAGLTDYDDAPLMNGQTFQDVGAGVTIQVTATAATSATVQVAFTTPKRSVRTVAFPNGAGQVSGGGNNFNVNDPVTLTAVPNTGFCFTRWRENKQSIGSTNPLTFNIAADRIIEAVFTAGACTPAAANDTFPGISIAATAGTQLSDNTAATTEAGEPVVQNCGNGNATFGNSVWYSMTAPTSGQLTIDTNNSGFDTLVAVYTGSAVNGLTLVACNDDAAPGTATSQVAFAAVAGTTYRIQVSGVQNAGVNASGNVYLNVTAPVFNACNPRPKVVVSTVVSGAGQLTVTLTAGSAAQGNRLVSVRFQPTSQMPNANALLDLPGIGTNVQASAATLALPGQPASYQFVVKRQNPGPVSLPIVVTDLCGAWTTFVGHGVGPGF